MKFSFYLLAILISSPSYASEILMIDPSGIVRPIVYENRNGKAITEGDIILGKIASLGSVITSVGGTRWPEGIAPYKIDKDLPSHTRESLEEAIKIWEATTGVRFIEINKGNEEKYPNYFYVQPQEGRSCSSEVGLKGGSQDLILSARCTTMNIVHELGHVLGLWHEQSRQDRELYVQIIWDNITEEYQYNFNQQLNDSTDQGPYNYESIMHYSAYAFSKNGEQTILPLMEGAVIGQRDHLSEGDIEAVKSMYLEQD